MESQSTTTPMLWVVCLCACLAAAGAQSCIYRHGDVTFDLTVASQLFFAEDALADRDETSYQFKLCGSVTPHGLCNDTGVAVFQFINDTNPRCIALGLASETHWSLADPADASAGVTVVYDGGVPCGNKNRTFTVHLKCGQQQEPSVVSEGLCDYHVNVQSPGGCPSTCVDGSQMCSGQGLCRRDTDLNNIHCFCNSGRKGTLCSEVDAAPSSSSGSAATTGLAVVVMLLLVFLIGIAYKLFLRMRELKSEDNAYGALDDHGDAGVVLDDVDA